VAFDASQGSRRLGLSGLRSGDSELAAQVAAWMDERPTLIRGRRPRSAKKKMSTTTTASPRGSGPGIEVEMDF
jgi:hypothetical protein